MMAEDLDAARQRILGATLRHVPFEGWTEAALAAGAAEAGVDEGTRARAFPGGIKELVDYYSADADRRMAKEMERRGVAEMRVRERIATAVRVRLEQNAPHREAIRRLIAFLALPGHAGLGWRCLYRTVDCMWYAAGDRSTDYNYYTKRALLAGVYVSTVLYWIDDSSEDFADTWAFLDRRIADVMTVPRTAGLISKRLAALPDPVRLLCRRAAPVR